MNLLSNVHRGLVVSVFLFFASVFSLPAFSDAHSNSETNGTKSMIKMTTSKGELLIELYEDKAPETVKNFRQYVESGFFDGLIFHRVIKGFMIQGGGFMSDMTEKPNGTPIQNEADNGLKNEVGTLAMARTGDPHSATSQFFINLVDNDFLNHTGKNSQGWGYAVFGKVVDGLDVVTEIGDVATGQSGRYSDVPLEAVVIEKAEMIDSE
ncbi:MAG: peptidyl-prolyl cis-trans isomerase [Acidiferrobacterales bacterium]|nr:peptidyl-prolyl cis-trans isomerase [Acidiferrobacterales bacterium]